MSMQIGYPAKLFCPWCGYKSQKDNPVSQLVDLTGHMKRVCGFSDPMVKLKLGIHHSYR